MFLFLNITFTLSGNWHKMVFPTNKITSTVKTPSQFLEYTHTLAMIAYHSNAIVPTKKWHNLAGILQDNLPFSNIPPLGHDYPKVQPVKVTAMVEDYQRPIGKLLRVTENTHTNTKESGWKIKAIHVHTHTHTHMILRHYQL